MPSDEDRRWGDEVRERAMVEGAPDLVLAGLIELLDRTVGDEVTEFRLQLLTRAVIAGGRLLLARRPLETVATTLAAAETYVLAPTEEHFDAYVAAATSSYPYGAGDGCYSIRPGENDCAPGSGCRSGAGSLGCMAVEVGAAELLAAIVDELGPWLQGPSDPVADRRR